MNCDPCETYEPSARECRKVAYPWLVEWLRGKFSAVVRGEREPADVSSIDFGALLADLVSSDMPPEVRSTVKHIGCRQLKEQYVRCVQFPKRLGTMSSHERQSVLRVAIDSVSEFTNPDGIISWTRLAEKVRASTNVKISEGNLKNMQRKILVVPKKLRSVEPRCGLAPLVEESVSDLWALTVPTFPSKRIRTDCGEGTASETRGDVRRPRENLDEARSASSATPRYPTFETVDGLTPTSIMRRIDTYLQELSRECERSAVYLN